MVKISKHSTRKGQHYLIKHFIAVSIQYVRYKDHRLYVYNKWYFICYQCQYCLHICLFHWII